MKVTIECDHCGTENRVPASVPAGKKMRCGHCKTDFDPADIDDAVMVEQDRNADAEQEAADWEGGQQ